MENDLLSKTTFESEPTKFCIYQLLLFRFWQMSNRKCSGSSKTCDNCHVHLCAGIICSSHPIISNNIPPFFCPLAQVIVKLQDILKEQVCNNFEHFSWSFWVYVGLFRSILFHLIVSWYILVYLGLFRTISCFFRLYLAISGNLGLSWTISGYPQLSWAILGYIRISLAISGYLYQVSRCK